MIMNNLSFSTPLCYMQRNTCKNNPKPALSTFSQDKIRKLWKHQFLKYKMQEFQALLSTFDVLT